MGYNMSVSPNSSPCLVSRLSFRTAAAGWVAGTCFINSFSLLSISWQVSDSIMIWRINFGLQEAHWGCCDAGASIHHPLPFCFQPCHSAQQILNGSWLPWGLRFHHQETLEWVCCLLLWWKGKKKKKTGRGVIVKFYSPVSFFSLVRACRHTWLIYILTLKEACTMNACWVIEMTVFRIFLLPVSMCSVIDSGSPEGYTALASTCGAFPRVFSSRFDFIYSGCLFRWLHTRWCAGWYPVVLGKSPSG